MTRPLHKNISSATITLASPLITLEEKLFFLKNYVSPYTMPFYDGSNNLVKLDIHNPEAYTLEDKLLNRVGDYLQTGRISLGGLRVKNKKEAMKSLTDLVNKINIRFDLYVRSNSDIINRINDTLYQGEQEFEQNYQKSTTNIKLPKLDYNTTFNGIHPDWKVRIWQTDFLNACRKRFLWGNAYGTGLGKTSTALMAIQDRQNHFPNERAIISVPSSTLVKWFKEAFVGTRKGNKQIHPSVYDENLLSTTLFIGLLPSTQYRKICQYTQDEAERKLQSNPTLLFIYHNRTKFRYLEKSIDEQLKLALLKYNDAFIFNKVFMAHETCFRIRMKTETVEKFIEHQLRVDSNFAAMEASNFDGFQRKINNIEQTLNSTERKKSKEDIFWEDMDFSIFVIDEAHLFKNSKEIVGSGSNGINYSNVKYLATPVMSSRGLDMLAKTHYLRSKSQTGEGIVALTATPITNSPVEIYSMLALIIGEYFINIRYGINGINEFLSLFCIVEQEPDYGIDDTEQLFSVFKGLNNLKMLHELLHRCIYYVDETDERVQDSIHLPEAIEIFEKLDMNQYQKNEVNRLKSVFQLCREAIKMDDIAFIDNPPVNVANVLHQYQETVDVAASPFNLIRKFENLILDEDAAENAFICLLPMKYISMIKAANADFNKKNFKYSRARPNIHTKESAILKVHTKTKLLATGEEKEFHIYDIHSQADFYPLTIEHNENVNRIKGYITENTNILNLEEYCLIIIDTTDYHAIYYFFETLCQYLLTHSDFNHIHGDTKLKQAVINTLIFNVSVKEKQLLENMKKELDMPRGVKHDGDVSDCVKQLVFCDISIHFKLQALLSQKLGIPFEKIAPLTGEVNGENDDVQALQDGFNAEDEFNQYQIIIANKKGEYGIDLQIGTQAGHHLTMGWTPDAETQRNGRFVRQLNQTEYVNVYHYWLNKTFDAYKRNMVNKKDNWIKQLFNGKIDYVLILSNLSNNQQVELIKMMGEQDADSVNADAEAQGEVQEREKIKEKQETLLSFVAQDQQINADTSFENYKKSFIQDLIMNLVFRANKMETLINYFNDWFKVPDNDKDSKEYPLVNKQLSEMYYLSSFGINLNHKEILDFMRNAKIKKDGKLVPFFTKYDIRHFNALVLANQQAEKLILDKLVNLPFFNEKHQSNHFVLNPDDKFTQLYNEFYTVENDVNKKKVFFNQWLMLNMQYLMDNNVYQKKWYKKVDIAVTNIENHLITMLQSVNNAALFEHTEEMARKILSAFNGFNQIKQNIQQSALENYRQLCLAEPNRITHALEVSDYPNDIAFYENQLIYPKAIMVNSAFDWQITRFLFQLAIENKKEELFDMLKSENIEHFADNLRLDVKRIVKKIPAEFKPNLNTAAFVALMLQTSNIDLAYFDVKKNHIIMNPFVSMMNSNISNRTISKSRFYQIIESNFNVRKPDFYVNDLTDEQQFLSVSRFSRNTNYVIYPNDADYEMVKEIMLWFEVWMMLSFDQSDVKAYQNLMKMKKGNLAVYLFSNRAANMGNKVASFSKEVFDYINTLKYDEYTPTEYQGEIKFSNNERFLHDDDWVILNHPDSRKLHEKYNIRNSTKGFNKRSLFFYQNIHNPVKMLDNEVYRRVFLKEFKDTEILQLRQPEYTYHWYMTWGTAKYLCYHILTHGNAPLAERKNELWKTSFSIVNRNQVQPLNVNIELVNF